MIREDPPDSKVSYTPSESALSAMEGLLTIPKISLDKKLKKYVKDTATISPHLPSTTLCWVT